MPFRSALAACFLSALWLSALTLVPGCSTVARLNDPIPVEARGYFDTLDRFTRSATLYHRLDTRVIVHATLVTPDLRQAYRDEFARIRHLEGDRLDQAWRPVEERLGQGIPVVIHLETPDPANAELEPDRSLWTLTLVSDSAGPVGPYAVTRVNDPGPEDHYFFPYTRNFGRMFLVRFPLHPGWEPPGKSTHDTESATDPDAPQDRTTPETGDHPADQPDEATVSSTPSPTPTPRPGVPPPPGLLDGREVTLRLSSVFGTIEFSWDIASSGT